MKDNPRKIVLAYTGGLDTSVILRWLIEQYGCEVVAFCADLGQGEELAARRRARARDRRLRGRTSRTCARSSSRDFVFPMLRAGAVYEGTLPARHLDRAAADRQAPGRDRARDRRRRRRPRRHRQGQRPGALRAHVRGARARAHGHRAVADWDFDSRTNLIAYAEKHGIPVTVTREKPLQHGPQPAPHRATRAAILEDPWRGAATTTCSARRSRPRRRPTRPRTSRSTTRPATRSR